MSPCKLDLYSERYAPSGSLGSNFKRLLGAPANDRLETILREAVQNSIDASLDEVEVRIRIRFRTLAPVQYHALTGLVLEGFPEESGNSGGRSSSFLDGSMAVMEICDYGTSGLDGPTRADTIPVGSQRTNFVDFVCNIGTPRDRTGGGGTYGFGKSAYYAASGFSTLVIDTLIRNGSGFERRFMACHAGDSYEMISHGIRERYTGRRWWGRSTSRDGFVEPATGEEAGFLAGSLGLSPRKSGDTGTTIMVLDPVLGETTQDRIDTRIIEILLTNFWPRMTRNTPGNRRIRFELEVEGRAISIPAPENCPPLDIYCLALAAARSGTSTPGMFVENIESIRPRRILGRLAYQSSLKARRIPALGGMFDPGKPSRHIALMRPVELVVKYMEGAEFPDDRVEWAGVFIASEEENVERAFAASEPPAHDDWIPASIDDRSQRLFVNVALRRLKERAQSPFEDIPIGGSQQGNAEPMAKVAGTLGRLLERTAGSGAGQSDGPGGGTPRPGKKRAAAASPPRFNRLLMDEEGVTAVFTTQVDTPAGSQDWILVANASIVLDGSASDDMEILDTRPVIAGIRRTGEEALEEGNRCRIHSGSAIFEIHVRMSGEYAVTAKVELERFGN